MKQLKTWSLALIASLAVGVASAQTIEDVNAKMNSAGELIAAKKYTEAAALLQEVIAAESVVGEEAAEMVRTAKDQLPKLYLQYGNALFQAKNIDGAIAQFTKAQELADKYGNASVRSTAARVLSQLYNMKGVAAFNAKDYKGALEFFQKVAQTNPADMQVAYFIAKCYGEQGQLDQAVEMYDKVIAAGADPKYAKVAADSKTELTMYMLEAASKAGQANDYDGLKKYTEQVLKVVPTNPEANLMLVQMANKLKKYDDVIDHATDAYAAQADPVKKAEVAYLAGVAYQNKDNKAKAIEWLKRVTVGPNAAAAKALAAEVAAAQ